MWQVQLSATLEIRLSRILTATSTAARSSFCSRRSWAESGGGCGGCGGCGSPSAFCCRFDCLLFLLPPPPPPPSPPPPPPPPPDAATCGPAACSRSRAIAAIDACFSW
jgi:hypothetical protein